MIRRAVAVATLLAVGYLLAGALSTPTLRLGNDTYQYAVTTLRILGEPPAVAQERALQAYCASVGAREHRAAIVDPARIAPARPEQDLAGECVAANAAGLAPAGPRYDAIFAPRVGYPLLAAPLVAVLDVVRGMWLASAVCTALCGALVFVLLRSWRARVGLAAAGQVLIYVSPIGTWGTWALAEGPSTMAAVAALVGAVWLAERRRAIPGLALLLVGLAFGVAVKYSTGQLVAAALCVCAAATAILVRAARHRGTVLVAALSGAAAAAATAAASLLRWPGINDTLQDKFTDHFVRADVTDPWARMAGQSAVFWNQWSQTNLAEPMLLAALAVSAWGLYRSAARSSLFVAGVSATGLVVQAVHPVLTQGDRLIAPVWILVAVGLPLAVSAALREPATAVTVQRRRAQPATLPRRAEIHDWHERRPGAHRATPSRPARGPANGWPTTPISVPVRAPAPPGREPAARHGAGAARR